MSRAPRNPLRTTLVVALVFLAGVQLVMVTVAAVPPSSVTDGARPFAADYLRPYFTQNWRLFAPNPVDEDRVIRFQGSYLDSDGTSWRTPWVDWTEVEQDLIRHRPVGSRAGYVSTKLYGPLSGAHAALDPEQQAAAGTTDEVRPVSWPTLEDVLSTLGTDERVVTEYVRHDRAVIRLATAVIRARWPDRELTSVRYARGDWPVVPYAARHLDEAGRQAARPAMTVRVGGWREPILGSAREREAIASFDRRHR